MSKVLTRTNSITASILLLLLMGYHSASHAATYFVKGPSPSCATQATNPGGNGLSWSTAFNNLDSALKAAKLAGGSNIIWVAKGTYKPCTPNGGGYTGTEPNLVTFTIPSNTTIIGGFGGGESNESQCSTSNVTILSGDINGDDSNTPTTLHTNKSDNAWHVLTADQATNVVLKNLTIQNGYAAGPDKGLVGAQAAVTQVDFLHTGGGGLVMRNGSTVTISKVTFRYNGAVAGSLATIRGGTFSTPLASGGGAITAFDLGTVLTVKNSEFDYNTALGFGTNGGAINGFKDIVLTVEGSTFSNNTANRTGGAVRIKDAGVAGGTIKTSLFRHNGVTGTAIGDESGGGIGTINSSLTVAASVFQKNFVTSTGVGGGLLFHSPFNTGEPYILNVSNSLFDSNVGGFLGGGGLVTLGNNIHPGTKATIKNTIFLNNFAWHGGGAMVDGVPTDISTAYFYGNKAVVVGGGLMASNQSDMTRRLPSKLHTVTHSIFQQNSIVPAPPALPPLDVLPPGLPTDNATVSFVTGVFIQVLTQNFNPPTVSPAQFVANLNYGGGGVAAEYGALLNVSNTAFIKNSAPGVNGGAVLVWGFYGQAPTGLYTIFNENKVTLSNIFCSGNTAANGNNAILLNPPAGLIPAGIVSTLTTDGSCP